MHNAKNPRSFQARLFHAEGQDQERENRMPDWVVGRDGFEPSTKRLKVFCSTD